MKSKNNKFSFLIFLAGIIFIFLFSLHGVIGAKVYGLVLDYGLNPVNAIVKINSTPEQRLVGNGSYSFDVPPGVYKLEAYYKEKNITYSDFEILNISKEGNYRIDLILFESEEELFGSDEELNEILQILDLAEKKEKRTWALILIIVGIIILAAIVIAIIKKRKKKEKGKERAEIKKKKKKKSEKEKQKEKREKIQAEIEALLRAPDKFKKEVMTILEKERRMLQKDLRKRLGVSEAKLSLLISELEEEGKVKKIKRGRGNILIWQE
ncbi:MAG: winged helix-turn-helix transcriptional regulator [Candidatus Pacearchaeota archaeon]